ncbi:hypothetical protein QYM36_013142 [Artemia franciscana]|uniref:Uncharacterized protein n=1 Tax=Artemia franciscana TaxID=6661 RepID=A0AA88HC94_ARTSF|nr:hypothetical protein QYM36_013142 [Artemia franciscana]
MRSLVAIDTPYLDPVYFFCAHSANDSMLHKVMFPQFSENVKKAAMDLQDGPLLAKHDRHMTANEKIAKELQWLMTDNYGEGKLVVMIRALHIEMTMDSVIGEVLSGIGWGQALIDIGVFPTGRCDTLEKGSNAKRSWYAYEVTVVALEELQGQAFCTLVEPDDDEMEDFISSAEERETIYPNFAF